VEFGHLARNRSLETGIFFVKLKPRISDWREIL
jgi:hypothetical protein